MNASCPFRALAACLLLASAAAQEQPPPPSILPDLQQRLAAHVSQPKFAGALWGVKIISLDTGKTLFEQNSEKLLAPASNSKLYTIALVLDRLGPDYRLATSLYAKAWPNRRGTLSGDLVVYGRGDPTINARLHGEDIYQALQPLVAVLTNAGVRRIDGDLVADATFFRGPEYGSGWAWDDLEYSYGAEVSALTINDNVLQVRIKPGDRPGTPAKLELLPPTSYVVLSNRTLTISSGQRRKLTLYRPLEQNLVYVSGQIPADDPGQTEAVTVHNPPGLFLAFFREALARHGIKVAGRSRTVGPLESPANRIDCNRLVELGSVKSPPLSEIAREVQKPSQNLYTDLLLAHVGEKTRGADGSLEETSEECGVRELNLFLSQVGVKQGEVFFEEGSGLSRDNLTTPNATVALLAYMSRQACAEVYRDSLPIAGVDGTLRRRMVGTAAEGKVRAKTGSLRWANSLSGYVTSAAGERLVFSIMLNRFHSLEPRSSARADIDALAVMLAEFKGRSGD